MTSLEQQISAMLNDTVESLGYELPGVELITGRSATLRVYIDSENGITVDDCVEVSRQISAVLDVEDPLPYAYNLEVSSPGLERPLFTAVHFQRFCGSEVQLVLRQAVQRRRKWRGVIKQVDNDRVSLMVEDEVFDFVLSNIHKANLVAKF